MEMSFCNEHGIPHSEFMEWLPEDRSKAMAFLVEKSTRCDMCGTAQWEWDEDRRAYEPVEKFCMGCYLKFMAQENAGSLPGTTISLEPTRGIEAAKRLSRMRKQRG